MIRRFLLGPCLFAAPWVKHPNRLIRRSAQIIVVGSALIWLAFSRPGGAGRDARGEDDEVVDRLTSSPQLYEFLHGPAVTLPIVGPICRTLVLRLSVAARRRERGSTDERNFSLRLTGPIDQSALRNLLVWQNRVLPAYLRPMDTRQVDVVLVLPDGSNDETRLFDLFSVALMLERFRGISVFWGEVAAAEAASKVMSDRELRRRSACESADDIGRMPAEVTGQVELCGAGGGIKLLPQGRRYTNDFLKAALPGKFIIAAGLRERRDGTVEPDDLEFWLGLIDRLHVQHPGVAFVMLNRLAPSQWRDWPAHLRFARHQGLTLQDSICCAQIADGFVGVLDILGLAAHSAGRPGVYVPLHDAGVPRAGLSIAQPSARQIMVGGRDRTRIETALVAFAAVLASAQEGSTRD